MTKPRVAILGLGSMGQRYVRMFSPSTVYGCDVRSETFPRGVLCFETVEQLLTEVAPTIAVIALPADQHLSTLYAVREAYSDCAILLEKPVTDRVLDDSDLGRCHALGGIIAVGYCWRFHPFVQQLYHVRRAILDITLHVASDMRTWPGQRYTDPLREFSHELDLVTHLTMHPRLSHVSRQQGRYVITGTHQLGRWRVRIAPYHHPSSRWIRLRMIDGSTVTKHWERSEASMHMLYLSQIADVQNACDEDDLTCPLRDALKTTVLLDEVEHRLDEHESTGTVM